MDFFMAEGTGKDTKYFVPKVGGNGTDEDEIDGEEDDEQEEQEDEEEEEIHDFEGTCSVIANVCLRETFESTGSITKDADINHIVICQAFSLGIVIQHKSVFGMLR